MDPLDVDKDVEDFAETENRLNKWLSSGVVTTTIEKVLNWARAGSLFPLTMGLACCAMEMMASGYPRWDFGRFGLDAFRASPRQADLMIVAGTVTRKFEPRIKRLYDQMAEPKWVISMGSCANTGGPYSNSYSVIKADDVVPVDVYAAGCPARPESLLVAVIRLMKKIQRKPESEFFEKMGPITDAFGRSVDFEELLGREFPEDELE